MQFLMFVEVLVIPKDTSFFRPEYYLVLFSILEHSANEGSPVKNLAYLYAK